MSWLESMGVFEIAVLVLLGLIIILVWLGIKETLGYMERIESMNEKRYQDLLRHVAGGDA